MDKKKIHTFILKKCTVLEAYHIWEKVRDKYVLATVLIQVKPMQKFNCLFIRGEINVSLKSIQYCQKKINFLPATNYQIQICVMNIIIKKSICYHF